MLISLVDKSLQNYQRHEIQKANLSLENNLYLLKKPFGKPMTNIKNKRDIRMEHCGTIARMSTQNEHCPFKTTLCSLFTKKSFSILMKSQKTPF